MSWSRSRLDIGIRLALLCLGTSVILLCTTAVVGAGAQEHEKRCFDDTVPVWWADYREQARERGKVAGGGSAKRSDRSQADEEALQAAKRELRDWTRRRIEEMALGFAQEYTRDSDLVTPQTIEDVVEALVRDFVDRSERYRDEAILRCDGATEAYVLVELDGLEIPGRVARGLIEGLTDEDPDSVAGLVGKLEERCREVLGFQDSSSPLDWESLKARARTREVKEAIERFQNNRFDEAVLRLDETTGRLRMVAEETANRADSSKRDAQAAIEDLGQANDALRKAKEEVTASPPIPDEQDNKTTTPDIAGWVCFEAGFNFGNKLLNDFSEEPFGLIVGAVQCSTSSRSEGIDVAFLYVQKAHCLKAANVDTAEVRLHYLTLSAVYRLLPSSPVHLLFGYEAGMLVYASEWSPSVGEVRRVTDDFDKFYLGLSAGFGFGGVGSLFSGEIRYVYGLRDIYDRKLEGDERKIRDDGLYLLLGINLDL
jgi:hypothetical protein